MTTMRVKFAKGEELKYISHLDLMRLFQRSFRRANIPVRYSEGFNPHPKFSLATALPLGVSSEGEYMDVEVDGSISTEEFIQKTNQVLPLGIKVLKGEIVEGKESIMSLIRWSNYIIEASLMNSMETDEIKEEIEKLLSLESIIITKEKKKGKKVTTREEDIRDRIKELQLLINDDKKIVLKTTLMTGSQGNLKPEKLIDIFHEHTNIKLDLDTIKIQRLDLFVEQEGVIGTPI